MRSQVLPLGGTPFAISVNSEVPGDVVFVSAIDDTMILEAKMEGVMLGPAAILMKENGEIEILIKAPPGTFKSKSDTKKGAATSRAWFTQLLLAIPALLILSTNRMPKYVNAMVIACIGIVASQALADCAPRASITVTIPKNRLALDTFTANVQSLTCVPDLQCNTCDPLPSSDARCPTMPTEASEAPTEAMATGEPAPSNCEDADMECQILETCEVCTTDTTAAVCGSCSNLVACPADNGACQLTAMCKLCETEGVTQKMCEAIKDTCPSPGDMTCSAQDVECQVIKECSVCTTDENDGICPSCQSLLECPSDDATCQSTAVCSFCAAIKEKGTELPNLCVIAQTSCDGACESTDYECQIRATCEPCTENTALPQCDKCSTLVACPSADATCQATATCDLCATLEDSAKPEICPEIAPQCDPAVGCASDDNECLLAELCSKCSTDPEQLYCESCSALLTCETSNSECQLGEICKICASIEDEPTTSLALCEVVKPECRTNVPTTGATEVPTPPIVVPPFPGPCEDEDYECQVRVSCHPCYTDQTLPICNTCITLLECPANDTQCQIPATCSLCETLKDQDPPEICTVIADFCDTR